MKKIVCLLAILGLTIASAHATLLVDETFGHSDGNLVGNAPTPGPGGAWANHSGSGEFIQVTSGQAVLVHGSLSREDANTGFGAVSSGALYYAFDFSVTSPDANFDEYFAHFKDDGTDFTSRLHIDPPTGAGDFTVGISGSSSAPDSTWASDLSFSTSYRATVGFDFTSGVSTLWINGGSPGDANIVSAADSVPDLSSFAFRQASSSETIIVDNLKVGTTFADVVIPEPSVMVLFGLGLAGMLMWRRSKS